MKKSIFLIFAAILCAINASAWSYKSAANSWKASTSGFTTVTMNSGKSMSVVMLKDVGDGVNICQNDDGNGQKLYCKWTKTSGDIFRGTARWNNGLYSDETVVVPGGKVYITVGSGTQVQMTAGTNYTYTADVTFSTTGQSYTISGGTVSGATITNENSMPSGGKPASLTMKNSYTSKNAGNVHIEFDLRTNKVTETAESAPEPEPVADVTIYFVNTKSWPSVNAYVWGTGDPYKAWPGEAMTSTGDKAHGYDVYSYTFPETYTNCIFNGNGQTDDLTVNAGQYYDIASKTWYATLAEVPNPTPAVMETVYFINTGNWGKVNAYAWTSSNNGWPGAAMTKEAEQIAGFDVYSFTAEQGQWANLIFNNGEGTQTGDLTWQAGKYYAPSKDKWYDDAAAAESALAIPLADETVYFVNNKKWANVAIYGWNGTLTNETGANKWPGAAMTKTAEQVAGFDVYSYTAKEGTLKNILFNYNGDANKTSNFVWTNGKYYYMGAAENYTGGTKEEVTVLVTPDPLATEVYLAGDMTNKDNWDVNKKEFKKATAEATTASVTITLAAQTYKFKLVVGGAWKGNTGKMERGGDAVHEGGWSFDKDGYDDNCQIVADIAGDYTFTWDLDTKKLTVAYPPLPKHQVTATVNPAETGEVTGTGEYEQGSEANLVATPNAGYAFQNWTKGGEVVSTEATYAFTVTADVALVANFVPEVTHEVTVSYLCGGTPIPGHDAHTLAVGVTTPSTITAPAITNYKFDSWTVGTGIQTEDDATDNPIHITAKAEGEYTLTANYTKIELTYTVTVPEGTEKCYIAGEMNSWSFQEMTPTANANEFTITIDGATTAHKYKYTCGEGWAFVEKKEDGSELDADRTYNANDVVAKWAEPAKCYLMGIGGDWETGIEMEEDGDQFKLLCQPIAEGEQFKFKYGDTWTTDVENYDANGVNWVESYPRSGQYNITLPAGNYDFYYKKNDNKVWIGVCTPATPTPDYTRAVTPGNLGTICLPYASDNFTGATFFEVVGKEGDKVFFDEVTTLAAGKPYIFLAEATEIKVAQIGEAAIEAGNHNSLQGTFTQIDPAVDNVLKDNYMVVNNSIKKCGINCGLKENRAYFIATELESLGAAPAPAHGVRRITMGVTGQNTATGVDQVQGDNVPTKMIINGQLFILRGEKMYDAQGKLVK